MTALGRDELPLTFRAETVVSVFHCVAAGDSCSLVGIGSVGKSNLLRFLLREDVRRAYLGDAWDSCVCVYLDGNKLLRRSLWGLSELMLHQLIAALTDHGADQAALLAMDDMHQRCVEPHTRLLALRYLDRAIGLACRQLGSRLVFLFDEFDELCRAMPPRAFAALRALRDEHKYRLMYVVATRIELRYLREDISEIETFEELVSPHTIWLGPYSRDDAHFMLQRLAGRHKAPLDEQLANQVVALTGGHPGLLREAYRVAQGRPHNLMEMLNNTPSVEDECQRIWLSLAAGERQALLSLAKDTPAQPVQPDLLEHLRRKGLIGGPWANQDHIFSPLFAEFVRCQQSAPARHIYVDRARRVVWVDGLEARGLTRLEFRLIEYLDEHRGEVCSLDALATHLYPTDVSLGGAGVTDERIETLVRRLRRKIEPHPKEPKYVVTVRGHGFCLEDADETETPVSRD